MVFKKGYKQTEENKRKISEAHKGKFKSNEYEAIHYWIRNYGPKIEKCEICGEKKKFLEWANKSHNYKRDLDDWMFICRSCHKKFDIRAGFIKPTFKKGYIPWNKGIKGKMPKQCGFQKGNKYGGKNKK